MVTIAGDISDTELDKLVEQYGVETVRKFVLANIAREDNPEGFGAFYELVFGRKQPRHTLGWIEQIYKSKGNGRGTIIEAFRGSTKTTVLTIAFSAFRIGKEPEKSNLLLQVGDDIAKDNTQAIANIIEFNEGWKLVYPSIVPDKEIGWGDKGYNVKDTSMEYGEWRSLCDKSKGKDPTSIGLGYKSSSIIGKHPTGMILIDDILDENNSSSTKELSKVLRIVKGTIMPVIVPGIWNIVIGTPWTTKDVLAYFKATGEYDLVRTPVILDDKPVWKSRFGLDELEKIKRKSGSIEYARMYLLDLEAA